MCSAVPMRKFCNKENDMQLTLPEALNDEDHGEAVTALRTYAPPAT